MGCGSPPRAETFMSPELKLGAKTMVPSGLQVPPLALSAWQIT